MSAGKALCSGGLAASPACPPDYRLDRGTDRQEDAGGGRETARQARADRSNQS